MELLHITKKSVIKGQVLHLPSSKSLSNRALILEALAGGNQSVVSNLSSARDTMLMKKLVQSNEKVIDVMDAGTTMRFLTAYFAVTNQNKILTGLPRMKERPIGLLVDALRRIGASIDYLEKDGYPPIETKGFANQLVLEVSIPGNVSSQYISALMMVGPVLPKGLVINLDGKVGSKPYIEMTAALMKHFGVSCQWDGNRIQIAPSKYVANPYKVEGDWSGASYWFGFAALAKEASLSISTVMHQSLQGDRAIIEIMEQLGINATFTAEGAVLNQTSSQSSLSWDFTHCPDLAQTVLPVCAARGIPGTFTGMESLRIKETDRIAALQTELRKINAQLFEEKPGTWKLIPGDISGITKVRFSTYHDHRMAMGLASLATLMDVEIESPEVVNKSYPSYWDDMKSLGFEISRSEA